MTALTITSNATAGYYVANTADNPVTVASGVTITNSELPALYTVQPSYWTISNYGVLRSTGANVYSEGILLFGGGGTVTNATGGYVSGYYAGVSISGVGSIVNAGTLYGTGVSYGFGVRLTSGGSVTNTPSGVIAGGLDGILTAGEASTVINQGYISGIENLGVGLIAGGTLNNAAGDTIYGGRLGVYGGPANPTTLTNDGLIIGRSVVGAVLLDSAVVNNEALGKIAGYFDGIYTGGTAAATITNAGTLYGFASTGAWLNAGGSVSNIGTISGQYYGVKVLTDSGTVSNTGTISAFGTFQSTETVFNSAGVMLSDGGVVTNDTGGTIASHWTGIEISGAPGTVMNTGVVSGVVQSLPPNTTLSPVGVQLADGGVVTNAAGGTIAAYSVGIEIFNGAGTVVNAGSISASATLQSTDTIFAATGVLLAGGGVVANTARGDIDANWIGVQISGVGASVINQGTIIGARYGIYASGTGASTVNNGGTVFGNLYAGARLASGGSVTNSGTVFGQYFGIKISNGTGSVLNAGGISVMALANGAGVQLTNGGVVTNAGVITGTGGSDAVLFSAGFTNRLVADPGAVFIGTVDGGNTIGATAVSTLELASGSSQGTLSGLGTQFINFDQIVVDQGANWNLTPSDTLAAGQTLTDNGVLLFGAGTLTNDASLTIANAASVTASSTVSGGADWSGTGTLVVGGAGAGSFLINNQASVSAGGIDIGQLASASGEVTVTGTQSVLSNTGRFTVGDAGLGSLGVQSAGTVTTSAGAIIANQSSASGSSVNVTGTGSDWQIAGTLNVGLAGAGALSVTNGGSVAAGAIDAGTASGGFGDIVVNGSASQLTATGDFIVGDRANADVALNGGGTISAGAIDIGLNPGASGVVDVEGDSVLNAAGVFNVGDAGNAVLSLGADATVNATSFNIGTAGVLVEFGDPINSGTVTNSNSIVVAGGSNTTTASVRFVDNGLVEVENSGTETITTPLITNTGSLTGTMQISTGGELVLNAGSVAATQTIQFADATGTLLLGPGGIGGFDAVIQDFVPGDTIIVDTYGAATFSQTGSVVSVVQNGTTLGVLTFDTATNAGLAYTTAGALVDNALCFLAGTLIGTPDGERPVQDLAVGDRVLTASGVARPVVWVGQGRVLATRGRRGPATPVIVRKGALGANVPHRDLHVTKGHALLLDGVLIPVEFLVNHRSVLWDDRAQEVVVYHVELATHDVLVANGAAAESYRDDGNRWLFANANAGWDQPPKPACAPVLTGGAVVDAVWRRLLERAGPRPSVPLTDEADVHLMVDGVRVEASTSRDGIHVFSLKTRPDAVRIASRAAVPQELGVARDPRLLGVALRRVVVRQGTRFRTLGADDAALTEGVHAFEPDAGVRWTDGDAALPAAMFAGFRGACEVVVHLGGTATYIDDGDVAAVA